MKNILVLGATGAMGVYLVPELARNGYHVDAVSLDDVKENPENITYIQMNGKDNDALKALLEKTSVGQCIECACCSYVCPAHKPLLEINNEARAFMKNAKKKEGGK